MALVFIPKILISEPIRKEALYISLGNPSLLQLLEGCSFPEGVHILFHLRKTSKEEYCNQPHSRDEENEVQRNEEVSC